MTPTRQNIIAYCLKKKQQATTQENKDYWASLLAAQQDIDWDNHPLQTRQVQSDRIGSVITQGEANEI